MNDHEFKLDYLKQRPQTQTEKLRADLDRLEKLVGSLRYLEAKELKIIPMLFDQVTEGIRLAEQSGLSLKGERSQLETSEVKFEKQAANYIRILGGREAVLELRNMHQPGAERWWWYPDRLLSEGRKAQGKKGLIWLGLTAIILIVLTLFYQRFLEPDEATKASLRYGFNAENLAAQGKYQAAFEQVELAIAARPGQADLYMLKGVLASILGEEEIADEAFQLAEAGTPNRVIFLISRASEYLRFAQTGLAVEDAQAALALDPEQASAYLIMGQAYETSGDFQNALANYRQADQLATQQNDAQVQVIARMSIGHLYDRLPALAPTEVAIPVP
jgi:tetratricopeptide (TPR) repeat protein